MKSALGWTAMGLLLAAAMIFGMVYGPTEVGWSEARRWLVGDETLPRYIHSVFWDVRLPRVLGAAIVGSSLSLAGILLQGVTRNPLADPFLVGTSAGASVAVVGVGLVVGASGWLAAWIVPLAAFFGALISVLIVISIAGFRGRISVVTILLAGLVMTAFCSALVSFILHRFDPDNLKIATLWLMGGVSIADNNILVATGGLTVIGVVLAMVQARDLNALALGAGAAEGMGVRIRKLLVVTVLLVALLTGAAVALAGLVGFVGLLVPHVLRLIFGADHARLIPAGVIGGATFVVVADTVARSLTAPSELPLGVLTALCGAPLFLLLLLKDPTGGRIR